MEEEVRDAAENARINLDEEEVEDLSKDFEEVLEMFGKLEQIDTENVEPSFHPVEVEGKTREDEAQESDTDPFSNTENVEDGYFKGPSI